MSTILNECNSTIPYREAILNIVQLEPCVDGATQALLVTPGLTKGVQSNDKLFRDI